MSKTNQGVDYRSLALGFHISGVKLGNSRSGRLGSSDPWDVLVDVLVRCQNGDFSQLDHLIPLRSHDHGFLFAKAVSELAGYAGTLPFITRYFSAMENRIHLAGMQYHTAVVLSSSMSLGAVGPLMRLHDAATESDALIQISQQLSYLLESDNADIWFGAEEETKPADEESLDVVRIVHRQAFKEAVHKRYNAVAENVGSLQTPVFQGEPYSVVRIAERLLERLRSNDPQQGRIYRERMAFEAATGIDCTSFLNADGELMRMDATTIVTTFLDSSVTRKFVPGQRYFFGHPIPE